MGENRMGKPAEPAKVGRIEVVDDDDVSIFDIAMNPANTLHILRSSFSSPAALARSLCPFVIIDTNKPQVLKRVEK